MINLGDFKAALGPGLDQLVKTKTLGLPHNFGTYTEQLGLIGIWQVNSNGRGYTFYSSRHKTHSRTDIIVASTELQANIKSAFIGQWIYSDHASVIIVWIVEKGSRTSCQS